MGNKQSQGGGAALGSSSKDGEYIKRCHYDVLAVERTATDTEIKKAYRKQALIHHPDRNVGNEEQSAEQFKLVQEAYDVLMDGNERAWYDSHREAILRGQNPANTTSDDASTTESPYGSADVGGYYDVNIMQFFSTSAYKGMDDSPKGFFTVYREVFDTIISIESSDTKDTLPTFGSASSDYATTVRPFYTYWTNFVTTRDFTWKSKWNLNDAPSRQVKRAMQAENTTAIKAARKEYNDVVRQLTLFVKKRDPRVIEAMKQEAEAEQQKQAAELKRKQEQDEQRRAAREAHKVEEQKRYEEQEQQRRKAYGWSVREEQREKQAEQEIEAESAEFECQLCKKVFKSEGQWRNHESSKQHKQKVQQLKRQYGDDAVAAATNHDRQADSTTAHECVVCEITFSSIKKLKAHEASPAHQRRVELVAERMREEEILMQSVSDKTAAVKVEADDSADDDSDDADSGDEADDSSSRAKSQRKAKPQQPQAPSDGDSSDEYSDNHIVSSDDDSEPEQTPRRKMLTKKQMKQQRQRQKHRPMQKVQTFNSSDSESSDDDEVASSSSSSSSSDEDVPKQAKASKPTSKPTTKIDGNSDAEDDSDSVDDAGEPDEPNVTNGTDTASSSVGDAPPANAQPVKLSAKQKQAERKAKQEAKKGKAGDSHACQVCKQSFPSRSKLFSHIKDKNHAALK